MLLVVMLTFAVLLLGCWSLRELRQATPERPQPLRRLRALRWGARLTYVDLAQRTGIPARQLAEIEHGLADPHPEQLRRIVDALRAAA